MQNQGGHSSGSHPKDCLACKTVGTLTFLGVAGYLMNLYTQTPKSDPRQRLFLAAFGAGALGLAAFRATN